MANIRLREKPIRTLGDLPKVGTKALDFLLVKNDLSIAKLSDYIGQKIILNIFPSIDTGTCAKSVREFNKIATEKPGTKVLCISRDLPFAQKRFCGAEGISNVETLSDFDTGKFGKDYQLEMIDGTLKGLHARVIIVIDENGIILHTEQVQDISQEPNYDQAISALING